MQKRNGFQLKQRTSIFNTMLGESPLPTHVKLINIQVFSIVHMLAEAIGENRLT